MNHKFVNNEEELDKYNNRFRGHEYLRLTEKELDSIKEGKILVWNNLEFSGSLQLKKEVPD